MIMKWDAATGRYVNAAAPATKQGVDTLPKGVSPYSYGAHYVDAVTGEDKIIVAGSKPDKVVVKDTKTGAWVPKGSANTVVKNTGERSVAPKANEFGQRKQQPLPTPNPDWRDNGWQNTQVGGTYVDTKTGETKRREPTGTPDTVILSAEETKKQKTEKVETPTAGNAVLDAWLKQNFPENSPADNAALAALFNVGDKSSGNKSSGPSAAQLKASANIQTQAGKKAQAQYNALAKTAFDQAQTDAGAFYNKQTEQANKSIDDATAEYLKNLVAPTAYSNVPIAQLTPEQQGLSQNLQSYGATDKMANEQMAKDTGYNQWLANFAKQGTQQMQQADMGYFEALKNAGTGGQAAARLGLAQNVANLKGQSTANAEAIRRQLIQAGIEAMIAGQTNAANTLAQ